MVDFKIIRRTRNLAEKEAARAKRLEARKKEILKRLKALSKLQSKLK